MGMEFIREKKVQNIANAKRQTHKNECIGVEVSKQTGNKQYGIIINITEYSVVSKKQEEIQQKYKKTIYSDFQKEYV